MEEIKRGYIFEQEDFYGIRPNKRALKIANYYFFWDCTDELAPFGSDEGYTALSGFEDWKNLNPNKSLKEYFTELFESWLRKGDRYDESILESKNILKLINDVEIDFENYVIDFDITIIGGGFGQLIIDGKIDKDAKEIIRLALKRRSNPLVLEILITSDEYATQVKKYCEVLESILNEA